MHVIYIHIHIIAPLCSYLQTIVENLQVNLLLGQEALQFQLIPHLISAILHKFSWDIQIINKLFELRRIKKSSALLEQLHR